MSELAALVKSGRIVDVILVLTVLEVVALVTWHARTGRGPAPAAVIGNIAAGLCLLAALRIALADGWWGWIAAALLGSLLAHLFDLSRRWTT